MTISAFHCIMIHKFRIWFITLSNRRTLTDLVTVYKYLNGFINCLPSDVGLETATFSTRGCDIRLKQQRPANRSCANLFPNRAASTWNKLPLQLLKSKSVNNFKQNLCKHLQSKQTWHFIYSLLLFFNVTWTYFNR